MAEPSSSGFPTENAVWVATSIEPEQGRWAVYLEVGFWEPNAVDNVQTVRYRIQDYAKKRTAEIAAGWIERAAKKDRKQPPLGF